MKIEIKTATLFTKGHFTGATIANDFNRIGHISIKFLIQKGVIVPSEVCGFGINGSTYFYLSPKNSRQELSNERFLNRYFNDLEQDGQKVLQNYMRHE